MELALTGVAVFVAIIAAYVAHQARGEARRSADAAEKSATASREYTDIELERRRDELAEREAVQTRASRAEVHAHIEPGTDGKPWLVIENRGPAHARDVQLEAGRVFEALLIDPSVLSGG